MIRIVYTNTTITSTQVLTDFDQVLSSALLADLRHEQEGGIVAFSPAFALELSPHFSVGVALNYYLADPLHDGRIRTRTEAFYEGESLSESVSSTRRTTTFSYDFQGSVTIPNVVTLPISTNKTETFSDTETAGRTSPIAIEGHIAQETIFSDLHGYNATMGAMWTLSRFLTLGVSADLPWTAEGRQENRQRSRIRSFDPRSGRLLDDTASDVIERKDVEFTFPLYWSLGLVWRWRPTTYTSLDISQTTWSDFTFKADGEGRINPLTGLPHDDEPLKDTWAIRGGLEHLLLFPTTEVPLRFGGAWEERPGGAGPQDYYSLSFGSGISFGQDPGKTILDLVYVLTWAPAVTEVPQAVNVKTDLVEHQTFVSVIHHF
jgi:long-subunit fatty acid transport protein